MHDWVKDYKEAAERNVELARTHRSQGTTRVEVSVDTLERLALRQIRLAEEIERLRAPHKRG
jgi:hypothetical protein